MGVSDIVKLYEMKTFKTGTQ